jgi:plastocyanin
MIEKHRGDKKLMYILSISLIGMLLLAACQSAAVAPTPTQAPPTATQAPPTATTQPPTPTEVTILPAVSVEDQEIVDNSVTVPQVISAEQGWIVIHADQDGAPGAVIGYAQVAQGENDQVAVEIDPSAATQTLYAMLHLDAGSVGEYEFPGVDSPVMVSDQMVVMPFQITAGLVVEPAISVEDQDIADGTITVPQADVEGPGWVVIHIQSEGAPGPVIGYTALSQGKNADVEVSVNPAEATETLYAMLHVDAGTVGTYEFPGDDAPLMVGDQMMVKPFKVTGLPPSVIVLDQAIVEDSVTVRQVVSAGAGWIVIHSDDAGSPGPVIGFAPVVDGVNPDIKVDIDESDSTATLYAMLHSDAGTAGTFDFPGDDAPVMVEDQMVVKSFSISAGTSDSAVINLVDNNFEPKELTVKAGTTVTFKNIGNRTHTVTSDTGLFDSGRMRTGDTFEFTFTESGEYPFFCEPHGDAGGKGMSGVIIVTAGN